MVKKPGIQINKFINNYIIRCVLGVAICYLLYMEFPQYPPLSWSIVSVAIATAEDNDKKLAIDRMKANLLGGLVGLGLFFIPLAGLLLICIGVAITILLGKFFKLDTSLRSAIAALVIVFTREEYAKSWIIALERVGCVLIGCLVALSITLCFDLYEGGRKVKAER